MILQKVPPLKLNQPPGSFGRLVRCGAVGYSRFRHYENRDGDKNFTDAFLPDCFYSDFVLCNIAPSYMGLGIMGGLGVPPPPPPPRSVSRPKECHFLPL